MYCYASELGNCSTKKSGEHLISKGLFSESISVKGLSWCKNEIKSVGINSLVSNILCDHHNSILSNFDTAAIKAHQAFSSMAERQSRYKDSLVNSDFGNIKHNVNGIHFEKWATKTFLNLMHYSKENVLIYDKSYLLRIVYTEETFSEPYGIHNFAKLRKEINMNNPLTFVPITNHFDNETIGCLFEFHGFFFMLQFPSLHSKEFVKEISLPESLSSWNGSASCWHPRRIKANDKAKRHSDILEFHW